ncbi:hypothetical protein HDU88_000463 [Geranomyces variabilis]|nr:hypothetical protein HDU88_000463 [Geranomyces variabilis]
MGLITADFRKGLQQRIQAIVHSERSSELLHILEPSYWADYEGIAEVVDHFFEAGVSGVWKRIGGEIKASSKVVSKHPDIQYIFECFLGMRRYTAHYASLQSDHERAFDLNAVAPFAKLPISAATGGPLPCLMSQADQEEKQARLQDDRRKGKTVDLLYLVPEAKGEAEQRALCLGMSMAAIAVSKRPTSSPDIWFIFMTISFVVSDSTCKERAIWKTSRKRTSTGWSKYFYFWLIINRQSPGSDACLIFHLLALPVMQNHV